MRRCPSRSYVESTIAQEGVPDDGGSLVDEGAALDVEAAASESGCM